MGHDLPDPKAQLGGKLTETDELRQCPIWCETFEILRDGHCCVLD